MSITINNSQNNVSITENNGNLEIIDNNTATSVNIPIEISTIATIASQGPKGDKGDTGTAGSLLNIPAANVIQPFVHVTSSGNISASGTGSFSDGRFTGKVGIGTTTPAEKLTVEGNITATKTVFANALDLDGAKITYDATYDLLKLADNVRLGIGSGPTGTTADLTISSDGNNVTLNAIVGDATLSTSGGDTIIKNNSAGGNILLQSDNNGNGFAGGSVIISGSNTDVKLDVRGSITASGNISASGTGHYFGGRIHTPRVDHIDGSTPVFFGNGINVNSKVYLDSNNGTITASGNISSSGNIYGSNIVLANNGMIAPGQNHQTIRFMTKPPGTSDNGEKFTLGQDLIEFFGKGGNSTAYSLLRMGGAGGSENVTFNPDAQDVDFKIMSDNTTAFNLIADADMMAFRDHVGIGYDTTKWPTSNYQINGTPDKQLMVSGITHLTGSVEIVGPITTNVTASGNISSSMTLTANQLIVNYDSMATSDPNVKGQVYRNGSNQLFISAG